MTAVQDFLRAIDERLLDLATDPVGPYISIDEYTRWQKTNNLQHLQHNTVVQAALSAAWQDISRSACDDIDETRAKTLQQLGVDR